MQKWLTNFSRYLFSQESFIGDVDVSKGSQRHRKICFTPTRSEYSFKYFRGESSNFFYNYNSFNLMFQRELLAGIYLLKVNNRNITTRCETCHKFLYIPP